MGAFATADGGFNGADFDMHVDDLELGEGIHVETEARKRTKVSLKTAAIITQAIMPISTRPAAQMDHADPIKLPFDEFVKSLKRPTLRSRSRPEISPAGQ
jgi:hypothetical protein